MLLWHLADPHPCLSGTNLEFLNTKTYYLPSDLPQMELIRKSKLYTYSEGWIIRHFELESKQFGEDPEQFNYEDPFMRCLQILSGHFLVLRWLHIGPGPNACHTKSGLRIWMQDFGRIRIVKRSGPVRSHPYTVLSSKVRHGSGSTPTGSATVYSELDQHCRVSNV